MRRGDIVSWIDDPRHHGIVRSVHLRNGVYYANVQWLDSGWHSNRIPVTDLEHVPEQSLDVNEVTLVCDKLAGAK